MSPIRSDVRKISPLRRRRRVARRIKFALGLVFLIAIPAYFLSNSHLLITKTEIIGEKEILESRILLITEENLSENFLGIFPGRNILIYPKRQLRQVLSEKLLDLADVDIYLSGLHTLTLRIYERTPRFVFCSTLEECYFLDVTGFAFRLAERPGLDGTIKFKIDGPAGQNIIGKRPANEEVFRNITEFVELLRPEGIFVKEVFLGEAGDLAIRTTGELEIRTAIDVPAERAARNLVLALQAEPLKDIWAQGGRKIEYLDLRFGNKVYYRLVK